MRDRWQQRRHNRDRCNAQARKVECPVCKAPAGSPCSRMGQESSNEHDERLAASFRAEQPSKESDGH